jgi:hypothetical protein
VTKWFRPITAPRLINKVLGDHGMLPPSCVAVSFARIAFPVIGCNHSARHGLA